MNVTVTRKSLAANNAKVAKIANYLMLILNNSFALFACFAAMKDSSGSICDPFIHAINGYSCIVLVVNWY